MSIPVRILYVFAIAGFVYAPISRLIFGDWDALDRAAHFALMITVIHGTTRLGWFGDSAERGRLPE